MDRRGDSLTPRTVCGTGFGGAYVGHAERS